MGMTFDKLDREEFALLWDQMSNIDLGVHYGVNMRTIQVWARRMNLREKAPGYPGAPIAFPSNLNEPYDKALSLVLDRCVIIGDSHIPDHDRILFEMALAIARKFGIYFLLVNGDFWSLDSFSAWAMAQIRKAIFTDELHDGINTLKVFLQHFKKIYLDEGNHCRRLNHKTDGQMNMGVFLEDVENVEFSDYDHIDLRSGDRDWYVVHPKNFSDKQVTLPEKLAVKFHKNIWSGHVHRLSLAFDPSGTLYLVEGGHCCDEMYVEYKQKRTTGNRSWNQGFGLIIDGVPFLIDKHNYDFWMSLKPPQLNVEMKAETKKRKRSK